MAQTDNTFYSTLRALSTIKWAGPDFTVRAIALAETYTYSPDHLNLSSALDHIIGSPIDVTNRTLRLAGLNEFTVFDADPLDFTQQGTIEARGIMIFIANNNDLDPLNDLLFYYDLGSVEALTLPIRRDPVFGYFALRWDAFQESQTVLYAKNFGGDVLGEQWDNEPETEIVEREDFSGALNKMVRMTYAPTPRGSARIYKVLPLSAPTQHAVLSFRLFLEPGWEFVLAGKLNGLQPKDEVSGGITPGPDEWSSRINWGRDGRVKSYNYHQDMQIRFGEGDLSDIDALVVGQWMFVESETRVNTTTDSFDGFHIVRINRAEVANTQGLRFRKTINDDTLINSAVLSTFYGGADPSFAPSQTTYALFDDFKVIDLA